MELLTEIAEWAWARHHNPLSWYIRPLFLVPFCYFAWRRSGFGIAVTLVALATSMAWFPAPDVPDPRAAEFLRHERDYLLGPWTPAKVLFALSVPAFLIGLGAAFWLRSWIIGLAIANAGSLLKIGWSFAYGGDSGWTVVWPAVAGLAVLNLAVLWLLRPRRGPAMDRGGRRH